MTKRMSKGKHLNNPEMCSFLDRSIATQYGLGKEIVRAVSGNSLKAKLENSVFGDRTALRKLISFPICYN